MDKLGNVKNIRADHWTAERAIIASNENFQNKSFALHSASHLNRVESVSVLKHFENFRRTTKYSNCPHCLSEKNILKINVDIVTCDSLK